MFLNNGEDTSPATYSKNFPFSDLPVFLSACHNSSTFLPVLVTNGNLIDRPRQLSILLLQNYDWLGGPEKREEKNLAEINTKNVISAYPLMCRGSAPSLHDCKWLCW